MDQLVQQLLGGLGAAVVAGLVAALVAGWRLRDALQRQVVGRLDAIERAVRELADAGKRTSQYIGGELEGVQEFQQTLLTVLAESKSLDAKAAARLAQAMAKRADLQQTLADLAPRGNPLSADEVTRIRTYVQRVQQGGLLDTAEAQDFYALTQRLKEDAPASSNTGMWLLVALGAFLLGVAMARGSEG